MPIPPQTTQSDAQRTSRAPEGHPAAGRVIVVFSVQEGVGKTVVATNLAVSLAQRTAQPVCLVDLDVLAEGEAAKRLNLPVNQSIADLIPMLKRAAQAAPHEPGPDGRDAPAVSFDGAVAPHSSGVHLLTAIAHPRKLGYLDPTALPALFAAVQRRYAYTVVDGGLAFSEPLMTACRAANLILLVASPESVTRYQTKWALGVLESLRFPTRMVKVLLNRVESPASAGTREWQAALPCEVIGAIPSDEPVVGASIHQGVPLTQGFVHTKVAEAFREVAEVLATTTQLYASPESIPRPSDARADEAGAVELAEETMWSARLYARDEVSGAGGAPDEIAAMKRRIHDRLVDEYDLKKLDAAAITDNSRLLELREKIERVITSLLAQERRALTLSPEVSRHLVKELVDEALGLGPLEELLADPDVTDILVNNKDEIYVERHGKLQLTTKRFLSNDDVRIVIDRIVAPLGRRIDESSPMVDAHLPDGSRLNAIIPPLSVAGPVLSIRKFARRRYTLQDLMRFGSLTEPMAAFLRACVLLRKNLVISGGAGSGKTTLLNVLSAFIPDHERIITIEDAIELKLAQRHWVRLEARPPNVEGKGLVTVRDLFRNALRMRPDRIIIGECRGAETMDMLQAMNTGHAGSMTTAHANAPRDLITRLDSMVLMSNIELPVRAIREMVASAIQIILHIARLADGSRKVTSVSEVIGVAHGEEMALRDLFVFQQTGVAADGTVQGRFVATGERPSFLDELRIKGIDLDPAVFQGA